MAAIDEVNGSQGTALVQAPVSNRLGLLRPIESPAVMIQQQNELRQFIKAALVEGRDYGTIPGVDKPSLLKPGAERVNNACGVVPRFRIAEQEIDHEREVPWLKRKKEWKDRQWTGGWVEERGTSYGLYRYVVECELVHRESGIVVGQCIGSCSTMESKYVDRPRDSENTALKMAEKRAYVGATLLAYGLSDEFTQDVEDTGVAVLEGSGPEKMAAPICPVHGKPMRDQRATKTNPKAPDWKCTVKTDAGWCKEVKWPGQWPEKPKAAQPEYQDDSDVVAADAAADSTELPLGPTRRPRVAQAEGR